LILTEGAVLGGGAFSRVSEVSEETTGNTYAMKRMRKSAVVQCPEHVYFEQVGQDTTSTAFVQCTLQQYCMYRANKQQVPAAQTQQGLFPLMRSHVGP